MIYLSGHDESAEEGLTKLQCSAYTFRVLRTRGREHCPVKTWRLEPQGSEKFETELVSEDRLREARRWSVVFAN